MIEIAFEVDAEVSGGAAVAGVAIPITQQVVDAVRSLPPYPGTDWAWSADPICGDHRFDAAAGRGRARLRRR